MGMKKVLVTGATGFLGEYLIRRLTNQYEVYALGRNLERGKVLEQLGSVFCHGDFTDEEQCRPYFSGMDYVIHAGAMSTPWGEWRDFYRTNVSATAVVCRLCLENQVRRLIYISSPSIYTGKQDRYQIREEQYDRKNDLNGYIKSKILAEREILRYEKQGLETVTLRPRGLVGIGDTSLVPRLLRANGRTGIPLFNQGRNQVDLTSVENVALACELALTAPGVSGQVFNITNGEPIAFRELLEAFLAAAGEKPKYLELPFELVYAIAGGLEKVYRLLSLPGEPPLTRYTVCTLGFAQTMDISKAEKMLGYQPEKRLKDSVAEYGQWWRQQKAGGGRDGTGQIRSARLYHCGYCINNLRHVFKKHPSQERHFPAAVAVIEHRKYGNILFDTGYSEKLFAGNLIHKLYRLVNPVILKKSDTLPEKLKKDGIAPESIKRIILSHGHPDHIGGLHYFQGYQLISTAPVIDSLRRPGLRDLVFKRLLPEKGTVRGVKILSHPDQQHFLRNYFDTVYDIFGDGSIYGVVLAGHSRGQLGLWLADLNLFLAADACWGSDLLPATKEMRFIARRIQHNFRAYQKTVSGLERLQQDNPEITIVFSHQLGGECVYGRTSAGS